MKRNLLSVLVATPGCNTYANACCGNAKTGLYTLYVNAAKTKPSRLWLKNNYGTLGDLPIVIILEEEENRTRSVRPITPFEKKINRLIETISSG